MGLIWIPSGNGFVKKFGLLVPSYVNRDSGKIDDEERKQKERIRLSKAEREILSFLS